MRVKASIKTICFFLVCFLIKLSFPSRWVGGAVIFRPDALGDFMIWLKNGGIDQTEYLKKKYGKVVLVCNNLYVDLAIDTNLWDEVVGFNVNRSQTNVLDFIRLMLVSRRYSCELLLNPRVSRVTRLDELFAFSNNSLKKICPVGYNFRPRSKALKRFPLFYSKYFNWSMREKMHQVYIDQAITEALTGYKHTQNKIDKLLIEKRVFDKRAYIVIASGAGNSRREWPAANFVKVANWIINRSEFDVIFVGSKKDGATILNHLPREHPRISVRCGKTSVVDLLRIIQNSSLLVCNESGPLHVAYLTGTPAISIAGGGHFGWFVPYPEEVSRDWMVKIIYHNMACFGCDWSCIHSNVGGAFRCIDEVSLAKVVREVDIFLESVN